MGMVGKGRGGRERGGVKGRWRGGRGGAIKEEGGGGGEQGGVGVCC